MNNTNSVCYNFFLIKHFLPLLFMRATVFNNVFEILQVYTLTNFCTNLVKILSSL